MGRPFAVRIVATVLSLSFFLTSIGSAPVVVDARRPGLPPDPKSIPVYVHHNLPAVRPHSAIPPMTPSQATLARTQLPLAKAGRANFVPGSIRYRATPVASAIDATVPFQSPSVRASRRSSGTRGGSVAVSSAKRFAQTISSSTVSPTGLKPWYHYEQAQLFSRADDHQQVNVSNGNVVLSGLDLTMPFRGRAFSLMRYYNSQSPSDVNGNDGWQPSMFGNAWSTVLDQHLAVNTSGGISYVDQTGARWDFTQTSPGVWASPPGVLMSMYYDQTSQIYQLVDPKGLILSFYSPTTCPKPAQCGRLQSIANRWGYWNYQLAYTYQPGSAGNYDDLTGIQLVTDAADSINLYFGSTPGGAHHVVIEADLISGAGDVNRAAYYYDSAGDLIQVAKPGNAQHPWVYDNMSYWGGTHLIQTVQNSKYLLTNGQHGAYRTYFYDGSTPQRLTEVTENAEVNPSVSDGISNNLIQPSVNTGVVDFHDVQFTYKGTETDIATTDGYSAVVYFDSSPDVKPYYEAKYVNGAWNAVAWSFDSQNRILGINLPDVGGWKYYQYDANSNVTRISYPTVVLNGSSVTPTIEYAYDTNSNLLAYCDPRWIHKNGGEGLSQNICSGTSTGVWTYQFPTPAGGIPQLTQITSPTGYSASVQYSIQAEGGGDYGIATSIVGAPVTQSDGTTITPTMSFTYDARGNMISQSNGSSTNLITVTGFGRVTRRQDADGVQTYTSYNADGSMSQTENAYQHYLDQTNNTNMYGTNYVYDEDGSLVSKTLHPSGQVATIYNTFDGAGRLVEVVRPPGNVPDATRFLFDSSKGQGVLTQSGLSLSPHGSQFAVERYLNGVWTDVAAQETDTMGRPTNTYRFAVCQSGAGSTVCPPTAEMYQTQYDATTGRAVAQITPNGVTRTTSYDALGRVTQISYSDTTPTRSYTYNLNGGILTAASSDVSGQFSYKYDDNGRMTQKMEPGGYSYLNFAYYPTGTRQSVVSSAINPSLPLLRSSYNALGEITQQEVNYGSSSWHIGFAYTPAGRFVSETDPGQSNPSQSVTYNYGWPSSYAVPQGTYSNITYDPDGNVTGYSGYGATVAYAYDLGSHLVQEQFTPNAPQWPGFSTTVQAGFNLQSPTVAWDARNGAEISDTSLAMQYDALGRMTHVSGTTPSGASFSKSNFFDSNNHQTGSSLGNFSYFKPTAQYCGATAGSGSGAQTGGLTGVNYYWSAEGHIRTRAASVNNSVFSEQLHWDGNNLQYTEKANQGIDNVKIGSIGEIFNGLLYIYDRDPVGYVSSTHTSPSAHDSWLPANPYLQSCVASLAPPATPNYTPLNPLIQGGGSANDPIFDGVNVLTGDRSYELLTETQAQPDPHQDFASGGTAMSFQNNLPAYGSDPTGNDYCVQDPTSPTGYKIIIDKSIGPDHIDLCLDNHAPAGGSYTGGGGGGGGGTPGKDKPHDPPEKPCLIHGGENDFLSVNFSIHGISGGTVGFTLQNTGALYINAGVGVGADVAYTAGLGRTYKGTATQSIDDQLGVNGYSVFVGAGPLYQNTTFNVDESHWANFPNNIDVGVEKGVSSGTGGGVGASINYAGSLKYISANGFFAPFLKQLWCKK